LRLQVYEDSQAMSLAAAKQAADVIRRALSATGRARIVAATGMSQMAFLDALIAAPGINWSQVEMFHLDEYIGIGIDHPASFRRYLLDRLITKTGITRYHLLDVDEDAQAVADRIGRDIVSAPIDIAFAGIGENAHLAFNDPPADFETERPFIIVRLDEACRRQQVGEGWFASMDAVPTHAVSMSIRQILKSREIVCVVPEARKAAAVRACVEGEISPMAPASILRTHENATLYLDTASAAMLTRRSG